MIGHLDKVRRRLEDCLKWVDMLRHLKLKTEIKNFHSLNVPDDDTECESFTVISIDSLLVYENRNYLQVYLDNCAYKIIYKQMTDYLWDNPFETSHNIKEYIICSYWFFNHGFKVPDSVCNDCYDLTILCLNVSDIAIIAVKRVN